MLGILDDASRGDSETARRWRSVRDFCVELLRRTEDHDRLMLVHVAARHRLEPHQHTLGSALFAPICRK